MMMVTRGVAMALLCLVLASVRGQEEGPGGSRQRRRCFTCRSRGERGDCRDPFTPPDPDLEENRRQTVNTAVEEIPCSTGWCSKVGPAVLQYEDLIIMSDPQVLEGLDKNFGDNDYGIATERQCMERAPSDNQERCDFVQLGLKKVLI